MNIERLAMRPDRIGPRPLPAPAQAESRGPSAPAPSPEGDAVSVSGAARDHERLRRLVAEHQARQAERAAALRLRLRDGEPAADPGAIARAMLTLAG